MTILLLRMKLNGTEQNKNRTIEKKEQERNDLDEGSRSRTERFKKSRNVPSPSCALRDIII